MNVRSGSGATSGFPASIDYVLCAAVLLLSGFGVVMVYSASAVYAERAMGDARYFLVRQAIFTAIGLAAMVGASRVPYERWKLLTYALLGAAVVGLVLCLTPLATRVGGASRWLRFGPLSVQPAELAKLALILWLAHSLSKKAEQIRSFSVGFLPHVVGSGVLVALVLGQPDFGTAVVLVLLTFALLFVAGAKIGYLLGGALAVIPFAYQAIVHSPYRARRILAFLDPWAHRYDVGYQISESLMSFGSGGVAGLGLGDGRQKLFFLPEAHNDFISAIIGEELGFVGISAMLLLYGIIVWRGARAALRARDLYGSLVAAGVTLLFGLHVLINLGVAMGMLPTKGLTLPFVSYGGSSLVINLLAVGIVLNVSAAAVPKGPKGTVAAYATDP